MYCQLLAWLADASSRPAGEPPRARRRRPQLLQRPLMASRVFPGRPGDRRWAAVRRRGSHARLVTPCAIRAVVCVLRGVSTLSLRTNCYKPAHYTIWTQSCAPGPIRPAPVAGSATHTVLGGLRGLHGDGASSWSPQRPFIGVFGERAAWLMMTEHGPTLEGTTYRQ